MVIPFDVLVVDVRGFYPTWQAVIIDQPHVLFSEFRGVAILTINRNTRGGGGVVAFVLLT